MRIRAYAYLDGLDELRLENQTRTVNEWSASCDAQVLETISEPFVKRMKFRALEPVLTWCITYGVGLVVARTDFLATQTRFLTQVHKSGVQVYSADLISMRGLHGVKDSIKLWGWLHEISQHRAGRVSAAQRLRISQRLNLQSRQDEHDKALVEEVYFAVRNNLTDTALARLLNERGRLQLDNQRYTTRAARKLRRRVLDMLKAV